MDQDLITDITLDHLPDLSEPSISFQIPYNNNPTADLLADQTGGFDLLCNAIDDDVGFTPLTLNRPRGPPLTLGELTPRVHVASPSPHRPRSLTPTQVPSASAKPSVTQHRHRKTPSRAKSIHRQLESPLVSSERFQQLRTEIETLGHAHDSPTHVRSHVMVSEGDSCSSHVNSEAGSNLLDGHAQYDALLASIPEEKDTCQDDEPPADKDMVVATGGGSPAEVLDVVVPAPPKSKRNPRTSSKPTVAAGGISKRTSLPKKHVAEATKGKPCRVQEVCLARTSARQPNPPQSINAEKELVPPACISRDIDSESEKVQITHSSTGGLAERLVSYSQKLISSIGLSKPCPESSATEASIDAVRVTDARIETGPAAANASPSRPPQRINETCSDHGEPFGLSDNSPHEQPLGSLKPSSPTYTGALQHGELHAMSPMRPAKKRASTGTDQSEEHHRRKKGKTIFADANSECGSLNEAVSQGQTRLVGATHLHEDRSMMHPETRDSVQFPDSSKATLPSARTKYKPKFAATECTGPTLNAFPYVSCSRQVHERMNKSRGKRDERPRKATSFLSRSSPGDVSGARLRHNRARHENTVSHTRQRSGPASTADLPLIEKKPGTTLCVVRLTKPVGFTFRVDARLEARKAEERLAVSEPGRTQLHFAVPDDKTHRTSRQDGFDRPEGVVPSVPVVPFFFCTEQRAKEREKFDEMVKRKEEEMWRLKEEQRRREVEEEERAIKELRRKAIPKANEVPEWYAGMPKRKGTAV